MDYGLFMSEPNLPKTGGLWARLFGVQPETEETLAHKPAQEELVPGKPAPVALPQTPAEAPASNGIAAPAVVEECIEPLVEFSPPVLETPIVEAPPQVCLACGTPRQDGLAFCQDCGWMFPVGGAGASSASSASLVRDSAMPANSNTLLQNRYEMGDLICDRQGVFRHRGIDSTTGHPVVIVSSPAPEAILAVAQEVPVAAVAEEEIMPGFDDDIPVALAVPAGGADSWPSIAWEKALLEKAHHPALPTVLDQFTENNTEYLVLEWPLGLSLWDAWDEPEADAGMRYGWLQKIAAGLQALHQAGAIYEGIRPDVIVIGAGGQPRLTDLADLLPLQAPPNAPIKATLYTAPELILAPDTADARSDLYSFGALIYSLEYLHHPLEEKDFEHPFTPLQITERFPDVHPLFVRLINKTFCRDVNTRFPTDEMTKTDPSGFVELIKTLEVCGRAFDDVRLDIAAWTTTGMVRTGNEDAFTVLHGVDSRMDDLNEYAMILLCDGMGGYEAGEIAAAMAINEMREFLLQQPIFAALTGRDGPKEAVDPKKYQAVLRDALKHANKEVFTASRTPGKGKRGMGCTAECVYIDSRNVIAGHVGDSRVYHLHRGRLVQLTRDQTLVSRLVELGQLTAAEAADHPRKNELQQAVGGQPDVLPGVYAGKLMRGDWVLVCSDGLTNHIGAKELETMLTREAANSAEEAARRLLNLVNLRGATDNATIVVVRAS
jgi:serine/threonine protein phosphatase PrpC/serine/threonine protein kinase